MIAKSLILLFVALILPSVLFGQDDLLPLTQELGSQDHQKREEATRKLWAAGQKSSDALKKAASSDDPEIARRADLLLMRIKFALTPETPEEVVLAMDRYWSLKDKGRIAILKELKLPDQALTLLNVWSEEKSPIVKEALADRVSTSLDHAINAKLKNDNFKGAQELLELFPDYPKAKSWLAGLYRAGGTLDEKIAVLEAGDQVQDRALLLACYRCSGDLDKALALAEELGDQDALASLSLLAGDCKPYLAWCEKKDGRKKEQLTTYKVIRAQAEGRDEDALAFARKLQAIATSEDASSYERNRLHGLLCVTGHFDLANKLMEESESTALPSYYYGTMQLEKWLAVLKFPKSPSEQDRWLTERVEKVIKSEDLNSQEAREITNLSYRLGHLGLNKEAARVLLKLQDACEKAGGEIWTQFLSRLSTRDRFGILSKAVEDDWDDSEYRSLLGRISSYQKEKNQELWKLLGEVEGLSLQDRFHEIAVILGWSSATRLERNALWRILIKRGENHPELLDQVIKLKIWKEPLSIVSEALQSREARFGDLELEDQWVTVEHFVFQREWGVALKYVEKIEDPIVSRPGLLVAILKQNQRDQEAEDTLKKALRSCLVLPEKLAPIASDLLISGFEQEGQQLHRRIALELPPSSSVWKSNLTWLLRHAESSRQRKQATAISMAMVLKAVQANSWLQVDDSLSLDLRLKVHRGLTLIDDGEVEKGRGMIEAAVNPILGAPSIANVMVWCFREEDYPELYDALFERSYEHFSKAISLFPEFRNVRNSIAWLCAISGRHLEEAERHSLKSVTNYPSYNNYDTLARIHHEFGNFEEELRIQELAVKYSPNPYFRSSSGILKTYDAALARQAGN